MLVVKSPLQSLGLMGVLWSSNFRCQDAKPNVHDHFQIRKVEMSIGKLFQLQQNGRIE
jgi:hypothetical protein